MMLTPSSHWQDNRWEWALILILAFWFSSSLFLDLLVMPSLYLSGMMQSAEFAAAGTNLFSLFNRIEVIGAAIALTVVGLRQLMPTWHREALLRNLPWAGLLFGITLLYTYWLTPMMGGLGMPLSDLGEVTDVPQTMNQLHTLYWCLEVLKLSSIGLLLSRSLQRQLLVESSHLGAI
ncbi:MAG: hypothetical protein VKJ24_20290 [Synechococcales bacterium]|nr:hypothetical protein [Synechococcales bacterium]